MRLPRTCEELEGVPRSSDRDFRYVGRPAVAVRALRSIRLVRLLTAAVVLAGFAASSSYEGRAGSADPRFSAPHLSSRAFISARFASDGRRSSTRARWDGAPIRLFSTRTDGRESTRLELADADVARVVYRRDCRYCWGACSPTNSQWVGTLARVPLAGALPGNDRGLAGADWTPAARAWPSFEESERRIVSISDQSRFSTKQRTGSKPPASLRRGIASPFSSGPRVSVETVDLAGKHSVLSRGGSEDKVSPGRRMAARVWFDANDYGWRRPLYAVTLAGKQSLLMRLPTFIILRTFLRWADSDIAVSRCAQPPGGCGRRDAGRDLSWHEGPWSRASRPMEDDALRRRSEWFLPHGLHPSHDGSPASASAREVAGISPDEAMVVANTKRQRIFACPHADRSRGQKALECDRPQSRRGGVFPTETDPSPGQRSGTRRPELRTGSHSGYSRDRAGGDLMSVVSPDGKEVACTPAR